MSLFRVREWIGPDGILWLVVERERTQGPYAGVLEIYASGSATPGFEPVMRRIYALMAAGLNQAADELERLIQECQ